MEQNLFEELFAKKQQLITLAKKASGFGWIDHAREREIIDKLENDVLTIGVIGQMKCGKSTFLNSFVFEDDILPAATTPMTAALSVITYGEKEKVVAEFYTKDEWEEQKLNASRSLDDVTGNPLEESKIKAAKELVEKSKKLGSSLNSFLGTTQEDDFSNLIEYVGADGKYISITKSVTIFYPKEYLKGVEIVDTPGFNDPIVSREERTKAFLKKADVVLMMLYAGRPFDATDREILFQNVRQCGIGKVIIGINKYDIPYENGETEQDIKEYVKKEILKACKECEDDSLAEILKQTEPVPLSAEMALLSHLPISKITSNDAYEHALKRAYEIFEISSQKQLLGKSRQAYLTAAVKQLIETEKEQILFAKPLNAIMAAGNNKKAEVEKCLREWESMVDNLNKPDDELQEKQDGLVKAEKRLNRKIDSLGDDLEEQFRKIVRNGRDEMEDSVDAACRKMDGIIDAKGRFESVQNIITRIDAVRQELVTRTLKRTAERLGTDAKSKIKENIRDFMVDAEEVFLRFVPDFDTRDFIKSLNREIVLEIEDQDVFSFDASKDEENYGWGDLAWAVLNDASWGTLDLLDTALNHGEKKQKLHKEVLFIKNDFNPQPFLETITDKKDSIIDKVKERIIEETINTMREQIDKIRSDISSKEKKLEEAKVKVEEYRKIKAEVETQLKEITF